MGRRRAFVRNIKRASRRAAPFTRLFGSFGMGLALAATSAWAQTPPAESPTRSNDGKDDVSLPGVDVRGQRNQFKIEEPSLYKLPDPIKDTPQSITVLPEQVLDERALFTLRDALRPVPGISLAAGEGGGRRGDNLTLRGFPAGNDIYIDGVRDLGQYGRDTFNLEAVEVLKGRSAVLFGRGSTGGVINQVSKSPKLTPFYDLTGTVGNGPQGRVAVDVNQPIGGSGALRLDLMVKWEPFAGQNMGRRVRAWVRPLHTGEAAGLVGQTIAFLASAGGAVLVWTGVALAWRRFKSWRRRAGSPEPILAPEARQEVSAD